MAKNRNGISRRTKSGKPIFVQQNPSKREDIVPSYSFCVSFFSYFGIDKLYRFVVSAFRELNFIKWPKRDEVMKTTGFILLVAICLALFVWLCDRFLVFIVSLLTGI